MPPGASRRHSTSGSGSPPTVQENSTVSPTRAVTSSGGRIMKGFTESKRVVVVN